MAVAGRAITVVGFAAGTILGGLLAAPRYYGPATTTNLSQEAITTDLRRGMRWVTACNGSDHTIREAERILAMMDIGILVLEQIKTVAKRR